MMVRREGDQVAEVWITPPRTASRSVAQVLGGRDGWEEVQSRHAPHGSVTAAHQSHALELVRQAKHVRVTVRNHWTTALSWFGMLLSMGEEEVAAGRRPQWVPQVSGLDFEGWIPTFFAGTSGADPFGPVPDFPLKDGCKTGVLWGPWLRFADEVVKLEDLVAAGFFGDVQVRNPHALTLEDYTPRALELVGDFFAEEIAVLGYKRPGGA